MNRVRVCAAVLVLALLGGLEAASSAAPVGGTVVLYTSLPLEIATEFARAFMAKIPQVKLEVLRSGSTELERRIFAEMETGGIRADVLWLADAPVFIPNPAALR